MTTVADLYGRNILSMKLRIMVFGPTPSVTTSDPHTTKLLAKRIQIRDELRKDGHTVDFAEDVVDPLAPTPVANPVLQEILLLSEYDLILNLVHSPGTIVELTMTALKSDFAAKSHFFICEDFRDGLAFGVAEFASQTWHAQLTPYSFPGDLDGCHLLGKAKATVQQAQVAKFLA